MKKLMLVLSVIPAALYVNGCGGGSDDNGSASSSGSSTSSSGDMSSSSSSGTASSTSSSSSGSSSGGTDAGDAGRTDAGDAGRTDAGDAGGDGGLADAGDAGGDGGTGTCLAPLTGTNPTTPMAEDSAGTFWYGLYGLQWVPTANVLVMSNPFGNGNNGELLKLDPAAAAGSRVTQLRNYAASEKPIGGALDGTNFLYTGESYYGSATVNARVVKATAAGATATKADYSTTNFLTTAHDIAIVGTTMYVSDPNYLRPTAGTRIAKIAIGGAAPIAPTLAKDLAGVKPNGIVGSNDGQFLYVATNTGGGAGAAVRKYPINMDGTLGAESGAPFIDVAANGAQEAEGLTIDDGGNLYVAVRKGAGTPVVQVYRPAGTLIGEITLPTTRGPNAHWVTFGDADRQTLYISVGSNTAGGGAVYTYRVGCTGKY